MNPGYEADQAENDKVTRSLVYNAQLGAGAKRLFLVPFGFHAPDLTGCLVC